MSSAAAPAALFDCCVSFGNAGSRFGVVVSMTSMVESVDDDDIEVLMALASTVGVDDVNDG